MAHSGTTCGPWRILQLYQGRVTKKKLCVLSNCSDAGVSYSGEWFTAHPLIRLPLPVDSPQVIVKRDISSGTLMSNIVPQE